MPRERLRCDPLSDHALQLFPKAGHRLCADRRENADRCIFRCLTRCRHLGGRYAGLATRFSRRDFERKSRCPESPKDNWPAPILLKYSGAKTWSAFAHGASQWSIFQNADGSYDITGYRTHPDGILGARSRTKGSFFRRRQCRSCGRSNDCHSARRGAQEVEVT